MTTKKTLTPENQAIVMAHIADYMDTFSKQVQDLKPADDPEMAAHLLVLGIASFIKTVADRLDTAKRISGYTLGMHGRKFKNYTELLMYLVTHGTIREVKV